MNNVTQPRIYFTAIKFLLQRLLKFCSPIHYASFDIFGGKNDRLITLQSIIEFLPILSCGIFSSKIHHISKGNSNVGCRVHNQLISAYNVSKEAQ